MLRQISGTAEHELEELTNLFRLLSDKTRLNIVLLLAEGEKNVSHLCELLQLPQPTVSHHLGLLRMSHLISNRRSGKQVFYMLNSRVGARGNQHLELTMERYVVRVDPVEE